MTSKIITQGATVDLVNLILLASLVLGGILIGMAVERFLSRRRRQESQNGSGWRSNRTGTWGRDKSRTWTSKPEAATKLADAAEQLRIVMGAEFTIQPLLNRSEARVF